MADCRLCRPTDDVTTPVYHDGRRVRVIECGVCGAPLLALATHDADPELEIEAYALGVARGLFGEGVAFCEADHGMPAGHWAAHVDVPTG